jgi:hypothetical protein
LGDPRRWPNQKKKKRGASNSRQVEALPERTEKKKQAAKKGEKKTKDRGAGVAARLSYERERIRAIETLDAGAPTYEALRRYFVSVEPSQFPLQGLRALSCCNRIVHHFFFPSFICEPMQQKKKKTK